MATSGTPTVQANARARIRRLAVRLTVWEYRARDAIAFGQGRWHLAVCPLCRGWARLLREMERASP